MVPSLRSQLNQLQCLYMTNHYNKRIAFAIETSPGIYTPLSLSPQSYQSQFIRFLKDHKLSKEEATYLKIRIQNLLKERAQDLRTQLQASTKTKPDDHTDHLCVSSSTHHQHVLIRVEAETQTQQQEHQLESKGGGRAGNETTSVKRVQYACRPQTPINNNQGQKCISHKPTPTEQISDQLKLPHPNFNPEAHLPTTTNSGVRYEEIEDSISSPRFYKEEEQQQLLDQVQSIHPQEDLTPRTTPSPTTYSPPQFQPSLLGRPDHLKPGSSAGVQQSHQMKNKKLLLLQNYRGCISQKNETEVPKPPSRVNKQRKKNPDIYKRLAEVQTISFQNKKMNEINTKEQQEYEECLEFARKNPTPKIGWQQDMSQKSTSCSRAKLKPEGNSKQLKELQDYQISFNQHLKRKEQEKKLRESRMKKEEKGGIKIQHQGSHCESKILRENLARKQLDLDQKDRQIKARIAKEKSQNSHRDLSKKSVSPASESNWKSRDCPSCTPKKEKQVGKLEASRKRMESAEGSNKKYVSNILNQSFAQFSNSIKNL